MSGDKLNTENKVLCSFKYIEHNNLGSLVLVNFMYKTLISNAGMRFLKHSCSIVLVTISIIKTKQKITEMMFEERK